ncbi:hypothetical protein MRS44_000437 [Fusarium solani]|jgi:hypothetical protein|uniref:uncharacterized protein n=1 Tax=Fusarium solani TaxID=169388 RepID=UPI00230D0960|nr:hypothetical protein MRS44_000437 [Fusarium solani]KAJ4222033.1 hypothetical protein NW759_006462 [Fusarium solani]
MCSAAPGRPSAMPFACSRTPPFCFCHSSLVLQTLPPLLLQWSAWVAAQQHALLHAAEKQRMNTRPYPGILDAERSGGPLPKIRRRRIRRANIGRPGATPRAERGPKRGSGWAATSAGPREALRDLSPVDGFLSCE